MTEAEIEIILERAREKYISWACRRAGISQPHLYEIKEAFEKYGAEEPG
jgi:hypothetical protein